HLKTAITDKNHDLLIWLGKLSADSSWNPIAHSSQTTAGNKLMGKFHWIKLRCPHLVLAYICNDISLATGDLAYFFNHSLGLDFCICFLVSKRMGLLSIVTKCQPSLIRNFKRIKL